MSEAELQVAVEAAAPDAAELDVFEQYGDEIYQELPAAEPAAAQQQSAKGKKGAQTKKVNRSEITEEDSSIVGQKVRSNHFCSCAPGRP